MDDYIGRDRLPLEIVAVCAMNAVLRTEGAAELAAESGIQSIGKDKDGVRGIRFQETKQGLVVDVYLNVAYGAKIPQTAWNIQENVKNKLEELTEEKVHQVNIHVMGVSFPAAERKDTP